MKLRKTGQLMALIAAFLVLAAGCARSPQTREARFLVRGKEQLAKGDYGRALLEFKNAAKVMPRDAEPIYQIGLVYVAVKDRASAIRSFRRATELNPNHMQAQLRLATLYAGSPNPEFVNDARQRLKAVLSQSPSNPDALDDLAITELGLGHPDAAGAEFEKALAASPQHVRSAISLAQLKAVQGDLPGAEAVLKKIAESVPDSTTVALALSEFYINIGRKEDAERYATRAHQLDQKSSLALVLIASIQLQRGELVLAGKTYQEITLLPEERFAIAHVTFLYNQNKTAEAANELEELHRSKPANRWVRGLLVSKYYEQGQISRAKTVLDQALRKNPKDADALLQRGELLIGSGYAKEAEEDLIKVISQFPNSAVAHYRIGTAYQKDGAALRARQEFQKAVELDPSLPAARLALARLLLASRSPLSALDTLDAAPPAQQHTVDYLVVRNWVLRAAGRKPELRKSLDEALAMARTPDLLYQDALLRQDEKDAPGASKSLRELLSRYPESTPALDLLAAIEMQAGGAAKALSLVQECAAKTPNSAPLQNLLGLWLLKTGKRDDARAAFHAAQVKEPGYLRPQIILAQLDIDDGRLDQARGTLSAVLRLAPNEPEANFLAGVVEDKSGNGDEAIQRYRRVLDFQPSHVPALNNLAYALARHDPDEALQYAQKAVELASGNPVVEDTMGWVYYRKGMFAPAVTHLSQAVAGGSSPRRQFHLGLAYAKLGDRDRARRTIDAALQIDPKLSVTERLWLEP